MIVIPAIDLRGGRCVRLRQGDPDQETVYGTDPVAVARGFEAAGARMLHVVDLDGALESGSNVEAIRTICGAVGVPVQVGGGLRSVQAVEAALAGGAARAVLGTAAAADPLLVTDAVARWAERIVVAVDIRANAVMVRGWRGSAGPVERVVPALAAAGAPRFLVTSVTADGTLAGPDVALYERIRALTDRPVIAAGGVRTVGDVRSLAEVGVEAVVVGKALYEGTVSLEGIVAEVEVEVEVEGAPR